MGIAGIGWASIVPQLLYVFVYLAGLIVAIILAVRSKSTAGILAVIAFALLFVMSLLSFARGPLIGALGGREINAFVWSTAGVGCCCGLLDVAAVVLLIIALWKAIGGGKAKRSKAAEEIAPEAEVVVIPEEPQAPSDPGAETPTIGISG